MPSAVDRVRFARFVSRALVSARERGLTDPQIEEATGIRASTFHRWKRGESSPSVDKVRQFCAGLGVSPREALNALGMGDRGPAEPEPIVDPDILALLRKLSDPNTNDETKTYIRTTLKMLANMPAQPQPRKRRAG
jgi:transcriptional regulator with XRE-family HTH domain